MGCEDTDAHDGDRCVYELATGSGGECESGCAANENGVDDSKGERSTDPHRQLEEKDPASCLSPASSLASTLARDVSVSMQPPLRWRSLVEEDFFRRAEEVGREEDGLRGSAVATPQLARMTRGLSASWILPDTDKTHGTRRSLGGKDICRRLMSVRSPAMIPGRGGAMEPSRSDSHNILQLAKRYDAELPPLTEDKQLPEKYQQTILLSSRTSLAEALDLANADARFLVCYIAKQNCPQNAVAVPALLAPEVTKAANRRPLGKKQADASPRSYYVWIADGDNDRETAAARKRLRVKPPPQRGDAAGGTPPVLAVVYPATARHPTTGRPCVVPRVVGQHHCQPPPSSAADVVAWLTTLRRRHRQDYARLQHERRERLLHRERVEGYRGSVEEDAAREQREAQEQERRRKEEEAERQRVARVEARRVQLLAALAPEPETGAEGVVTIALRFAAQGSGNREQPMQRRFDKNTTRMNDVFDWVDAVHGLEREMVELSTMNGARKFIYTMADENSEDGDNSMTLEEAGLGKMVALRVTEIVAAEDREGSSEEDEVREESDKN